MLKQSSKLCRFVTFQQLSSRTCSKVCVSSLSAATQKTNNVSSQVTNFRNLSLLCSRRHTIWESYRTSSQFAKNDINFDEIFGNEEEAFFFDEEERPPTYSNREEYGKELDLHSLKSDKDDADKLQFNRSFYQESRITAERPSSEIDHYYHDNSITVSGRHPPKPVLSFDEIHFPDHVMHKLMESGFDQPTPIQAITWPVTMSGRNVIGIAQTGSGKTLSFLLPALVHMADQERPGKRQGPIALVLCPTRELAKQCSTVANKYFGEQLRTACLFGGGERQRQVEELYQGCDLVVATPGRLMDLLADRRLTLKRCTFLVLDEADRMLDMGFEPQIRRIIDLIRPDRQVTMWSATWPKEVRELASRYLASDEDPVHIQVGSSDLTANKDVEQKFLISSSGNKPKVFLEAVKAVNDKYRESGKRPKILVFTNMKRTCDSVASALKKGGLKAEPIHGDVTQRQRDYLMNGFRRNYFPVLVATDVAARGLDVDNIDYVINFDAPKDSVTYIHRIGRTGRGGKKGTSLTIMTESDGGIVADVIKCIQDVGKPVDEKLIQLKQWWNKKRQEMKMARKQQSWNPQRSERGDRFRRHDQQTGYRPPYQSRRSNSWAGDDF